MKIEIEMVGDVLQVSSISGDGEMLPRLAAVGYSENLAVVKEKIYSLIGGLINSHLKKYNLLLA